MNKSVLIIGKNGKTGNRVEHLLQAAGITTRGVSRNTSPVFDWKNQNTWNDAMKGCQSAYVSFQPDLAIPEAQEIIKNFIETAKQENLQHIVLLSGRGEKGAEKAEQQVIQSGLTWNILRASWFNQNFSEGFLQKDILNRHVALPSASIKEPFIDADDIAEVAVQCFKEPAWHNQLLELTGPELLTFESCISIISDITGQPIEFRSISTEQLITSLQRQGQPQEVLWLMKELFTEVMDGRNSYLTDDVQNVLRRPARRFSDYVLKNFKYDL